MASRRKHPPLLRSGLLSGSVYVVTRYTTHGDSHIIAHDKYDVSEDFRLVALDHLGLDERKLALLLRDCRRGLRAEGESADALRRCVAALRTLQKPRTR